MRDTIRQVSGVLLLDKSPGLTSNSALQMVKSLYRTRKAGHTGTLDPLASGLLPVCLGEATKFSQRLLNSDKTYQAVIKLGETTSTGDAEGDILARRNVKASRADVVKALNDLRGSISQIPPMYSALKYRGKPLYTYARQGEEVARAPRKVRIDILRLDNIAGKEIAVTIHCSKGTYIRVLAEDLGKRLGCGAYIKMLRRTEVGAFSLSGAFTLQQLEAMSLKQRVESIMPIDSLLQEFPKVYLDDRDCHFFSRGNAITPTGPLTFSGVARIYNSKQSLVGIAEITAGGEIKPKRVLAVTQPQNEIILT